MLFKLFYIELSMSPVVNHISEETRVVLRQSTEVMLERWLNSEEAALAEDHS